LRDLARGVSGRVTDSKLTRIPGAMQMIGTTTDDFGSNCPDTGNGCTDFFSFSIANTLPSRDMTWFQAVAFCRNSGKRLLTNHEWQAAALGTPDPGTDDGIDDCNVALYDDSFTTGSRANCVSDVGAFDMVGSVSEWVADWLQGSSVPWDPSPPNVGITNGPTYGNDDMHSVNPARDQGVDPDAFRFPSAVIRGGSFGQGEGAGVFAFTAVISPAGEIGSTGTRCARVSNDVKVGKNHRFKNRQ